MKSYVAQPVFISELSEVVTIKVVLTICLVGKQESGSDIGSERSGKKEKHTQKGM